MEEFLHVEPLSPLRIEDPSETTAVSTENSDPNPSVEAVSLEYTTGEVTCPTSDVSVSSPQSGSCRQSLSTLLVDHTPCITHTAGSKQSIHKARLLTSSECLAMLEEKEMKKKKAQQRQKEREQKNKRKEEEAK